MYKILLITFFNQAVCIMIGLIAIEVRFVETHYTKWAFILIDLIFNKWTPIFNKWTWM